jgi:hypothetical protein
MIRYRDGTDEIKAVPVWGYAHLIGVEKFGLFQRNYGCIGKFYVNMS